MDFFGGFMIFHGILFVIIFGIFIFIFISILGKGFKQKKKDDNSPVLSVDAKVVTKRSRAYGNNMVNQSYYVTFQVESGDRMELNVNGNDFGMLAEGDSGKLTFQGSRFISFERGY